MLTTYYRPANDLDLKAITKGHGSLARNLLRTAFPVAVFIFGVVYAWRRSVTAASIVAAGLFLASVVSNIRFFRDVKHRESAKKDAAAVEVFDVSASSVLDLQAVGDNAPAFCFFVDEGKALLLVGQWLLDYDSFPADSFRLHRWADNKAPIRIEVTGRSVEAEQSTIQLRPAHRFGTVEILDAAPETLQDDLDRAFARVPQT